MTKVLSHQKIVQLVSNISYIKLYDCLIEKDVTAFVEDETVGSNCLSAAIGITTAWQDVTVVGNAQNDTMLLYEPYYSWLPERESNAATNAAFTQLDAFVTLQPTQMAKLSLSVIFVLTCGCLCVDQWLASRKTTET